MSGAHNKYVPAAFFGIVLGLAGLGTSWRIAASVWPVPQSIGEAITLTAVAVWAVLVILYASKWIWAPAEGLAEFHHPVLGCFVGVVPVSTALIGVAIRPYALHTAEALAAVGIVGQLIFGLYRTGQLKEGWPGSRDDHAGAVPLKGSPASGPPDLFAKALIGYALFQVLLMIRLLPWIARQPFAPSYWAFTFGLSALAISWLRFVDRGAIGPIPLAAPYVLIAVSLTIGGIAVGTLWLPAQGTAAPASAPAAPRKPAPNRPGYIEYARRSGPRLIQRVLCPRTRAPTFHGIHRVSFSRAKARGSTGSKRPRRSGALRAGGKPRVTDLAGNWI
jgi:tellurite resistance protein TehA-like permease